MLFFFTKTHSQTFGKKISWLASQQLKTDFNCAEFHIMNRIAHAAKMAPFILPHFWEERIDLMYISDLFFLFFLYKCMKWKTMYSTELAFD